MIYQEVRWVPRGKVVNQTPKRRNPGQSLEARENRLILLATNLVEERLLNGTASAQEVTQILKLGTTRERLEQERLRNENALSQAKKQSIENEQRKDVLYQEALDAFRRYSGNAPDDDDDYDDYD